MSRPIAARVKAANADIQFYPGDPAEGTVPTMVVDSARVALWAEVGPDGHMRYRVALDFADVYYAQAEDGQTRTAGGGVVHYVIEVENGVAAVRDNA